MPDYDYFMQDGQTVSIRRYPVGEQKGERWNGEKGKWTPECAPRRACELTCDRRIDEEEMILQ